MDTQTRIADIEQRIAADPACQLLASGAQQLVMGEGNLNADIVFIGEAPGKKEDELGRPFVGASGRLLDELLDSIGLARHDIYITNIIKYRPPANRDPTRQEKAVFLPYLREQLAVIEPKIIVTLGRHSMEYFLPAATISQAHGRAVQWQSTAPETRNVTWQIMPLYHPAAALYNGSLRAALFNDMQNLRTLIDSLEVQ